METRKGIWSGGLTTSDSPILTWSNVSTAVWLTSILFRHLTSLLKDVRDLLEHVRNPFEFLNHSARVLNTNGKILFITPNGREDFWLINQNWIHGKQPTLLMLNHFHYFLPETLDAMLKSNGFAPQVAFKWGLKQHRKGLGWKQFTEVKPFTLPKFVERETNQSVSELWKHDFTEVSSSPLNNLGLLSTIYSYLVDRELQKVHYLSTKGHEFFVFAEKMSD